MRVGRSRLVVIDVRNPDPEIEPGDQKSLAVAPVPNPAEGVRPLVRRVVLPVCCCVCVCVFLVRVLI